MFTKNVGRTDRIIRAIIGVVLLIVFFSLAAGVWKWLALIVGLVLLVTAALGTCPPYSLLGINTCKMKENQS
ncbi:YgaP family membrane protein [Aliiroseovarius sp. PTFE2010]|uniref:YgaP family membrane protein n=1 Tax=Aliiroseovarius sp. PTFE2010 TaxID=3417190 RepID=UPI003CF71C57